MVKPGDQCDCGGTFKTPQDLGLSPEAVVSDGGWIWQLKDALICDKCGANYLIEETPDLARYLDE